MELLDQITVPREQPGSPPAVLQLLRGDLAAIPAEHAVDLLVVSAFPDSYTPNSGTLFESLHRSGLDMRRVAQSKAMDERENLGCWLSKPLAPTLASRLNFRRILCFEPQFPGFLKRMDDPEFKISGQVGQIFRCLNSVAIPEVGRPGKPDASPVSRVAMPLLATGNQGEPVDRILPRLLKAARFWLERGLPIQTLKWVAFRNEDVPVARAIFGRTRRRAVRAASVGPTLAEAGQNRPGPLASRLIDSCRQEFRSELLAAATSRERPVLERVLSRVATAAPNPTPSASGESYDVFVSYAHRQDAEVAAFVSALHASAPDLRVFHDRSAIPVGDPWIRRISDAIQGSRTFVAILSPDYSASPVCWDEFQCAKLREYTSRNHIIQTIRLYKDSNLPSIMGIYSFEDCAEGDVGKLKQAAARVGRSASASRKKAPTKRQ